MNFKKVIIYTSIFILNIITVKAQTTDYDALWKKIDKANEKGLTKDANKIAVQIFDDAVKSNNDVQQIKAAMHLMKFKNAVEEDNQQKNIFYVDTLIAKAKAPAKNILQSMQAQLFQTFKEYNRYKLYNRTKLEEEKSKDINTWSIDKLNNTIANLYKASLKNDAVLKATNLKSITAILEKGNTENLRPTLYDLLAHRAIDFFTNGENDVTKPAYKFIINDENAFAPTDVFANYNFKTKDTASYYFNAIKVMQSLLAYRLTDTKNVDALLDADLKRLAFMNAHGIFTNKEKLYENALLQIETKYNNNPTSALAAYLRANMLIQHGNGYNAISNKEAQFELVKAKQILEAAANKFPTSEGGINCKNALSGIERPSLHFEIEKVNVINEAFRTLVQYKNINATYCRIVKVTREQIKQLYNNDNYDKTWAKIAALKPVKTWTQNLPSQNDYQSHSVEIKIDGLAQGTYFLLMSKNENFAQANNIICRNTFYISNISYINNDNKEMYVLNRENGSPMANATVQLWNNRYDYNKRENIEEKGALYTTNKDGFIKKNKKENQNNDNTFYQIKTSNDELFTDDNHYEYYDDYDNESYETKHISLFTDRAIYRPGQTVFFKGILMETDKTGRNSKLLTAKKTAITLMDANYQKVISQSFTTNEYGSFNGNFKLPEGLLNGNFHLQDSLTGASQQFSVEEYKRPKFFTEIKKPTGTYKINDSINVVANAKAYAGNFVDGAAVSYRVVRVVRYPDWWGYYRRGRSGYNRGSEEMEITNGKTTTDAKGEFKIKFKAIPDEAVDKKSQPIFEYKVTADVTDINGETRSGNTLVAVSYQALKLDIVSSETINIVDVNKIGISTTNSNNLFEKAKVQVALYKLDEPTKMFRSRYWEQPDVFVMTKSEYYTAFPYDVYANEDEMQNWELAPKSIDVSDSTKEDNKFTISNAALKTGWYKITATTKDKYGEEVKAEKYIRLFETIFKSPLSPGEGLGVRSQITIDKIKTTAEPGEKLQYNITTGFDKIWLIQSISKALNNNSSAMQIVANTTPFKNEMLVTENDRGGINMNYVFVKHNRYYQGNENFAVPWSNKDLNISFETFRDKLEPGSKEKWKIKITGNKADKVAAEALVSMYDASLDQFKPHSWNDLKFLWPNGDNNYSWNTPVFSKIESDENNTMPQKYIDGINRYYATLLNNGWNDYYGRYKTSIAYSSAAISSAELSNVVVTPKAMATMKSKREDRAISQSAGYDFNLDSNVSGGTPGASGNIQIRGTNSISADNKALIIIDGVIADGSALKAINQNDIISITTLKSAEAIALYGEAGKEGAIIIKTKNGAKNNIANADIKIRKNFNETAFFYPDLKTDADGNIEFSFTMPEALTEWKMMVLGHTKDLASAIATKKTINGAAKCASFFKRGRPYGVFCKNCKPN